MNQLLQNIRFGIRLHRRSLGYTVVTLVTLAVGVGVNTAVFSTAYNLLYRPLPGINRPQGLVQVYRSRARKGVTNYSNLVSYPNFFDYRKKNTVFSEMASWRDVSVGLSAEATKAALFQASAVSTDFFAALELEPAQGRFFLPEEAETPGSSSVAVVSYGLWQSYFGSDRSLLGRKINLNGRPFVVVGIAPKGFRGLKTGQMVDLWVPITMLDQLQPEIKGWFSHRDFNLLNALGRIKPDLDLKRAQAAADVLAHQMQEAYPKENKEIGLYLLSHLGLELKARNQISRLSLTLMGTAVLVLLVACINLANLTSAHTFRRQTELGMRLALGAHRSTLLFQLFTETLLLSIAGGLLGLIVAFATTRIIATFVLVKQYFPGLEFSLDYRVVLFAITCGIFSGLAFTLFPVLRVLRLELNQITKDRNAHLGSPRHRFSDLLIVLQVSLVLAILTAAGLLLKTFRNYMEVDRGFDARNVLVIPFDLTLENYSEAKGRIFVEQVLRGVEALPGVNTVSISMITPISGDYLESRAQTATQGPNYVDLNVVSPEYFKALSIRLEKGRNFMPQDLAGGQAVAIVSGATPARFSLGNDPLGQLLSLPDKPTGVSQIQIVGVAADSKYRNLSESPRAVIYLPWSQNYVGQLTLVVRSSVPAAQLLGSVQKTIHIYDKDFPVSGAKTLEEQVEDSLGEQSMTAGLVTSLGVLSLLLSMIGLYGLLFYLVSQQKREIGIRMALGARRGKIFQLVLWHGLKLTLIGIVIGGIAATLLLKFLGSVLYGVKPGDPVTLGTAAAILILVSLAASYLPAHRATKVDPALSLHQQ